MQFSLGSGETADNRGHLCVGAKAAGLTALSLQDLLGRPVLGRFLETQIWGEFLVPYFLFSAKSGSLCLTWCKQHGLRRPPALLWGVWNCGACQADGACVTSPH